MVSPKLGMSVNSTWPRNGGGVPLRVESSGTPREWLLLDRVLALEPSMLCCTSLPLSTLSPSYIKSSYLNGTPRL